MDVTDRDFCTGWELGPDDLKRGLPCKTLNVSPTFKFFCVHLVTMCQTWIKGSRFSKINKNIDKTTKVSSRKLKIKIQWDVPYVRD